MSAKVKREQAAIEENPHAPVTKSAYARWIGVTPQRVNALLKSGQIHQTADGKIIPHEADIMRAATGEIQVRSFEPGTSVGRKTSEQVNPDGRTVAELSEELLLHKAEHEKQKARLATLKADEEEGDLIRVEVVERIFFDITRTVRDGIQVLPDKLASVVLALDDYHAVRSAIAKEIDHVLKSLAVDINDQIEFERDESR